MFVFVVCVCVLLFFFLIILQPDPRKNLSSGPDICVTQAHTGSERNVEISGEVVLAEPSDEW